MHQDNLLFSFKYYKTGSPTHGIETQTAHTAILDSSWNDEVYDRKVENSKGSMGWWVLMGWGSSQWNGEGLGVKKFRGGGSLNGGGPWVIKG